MGIKLIITGVTGMVGEGVLHEALLSPQVDKVLIVARRSMNMTHPKLSEIILKDFFNVHSIETSIIGYDACLFCLGVSSVGMKKEEYEGMTYNLTMGFANTLLKFNPNMQFCYISGAGTDTSEKGKLHWARVKGKTENDLQKLGFKNVWLFRPGILKPTKGLKNTLSFYKWAGWLIPPIEYLFPNSITSLSELGQAMINVVLRGYEKHILEVADIKALSRKG